MRQAGGDSWYCDGTVIFKRHYFIVFIKTLLFEKNDPNPAYRSMERAGFSVTIHLE